MNYRLITRWNMTKEVTEQYFPAYGDVDTIADYLIRAIDNGGKISWVIQEKQKNGQVITCDFYGDVGDWENISWSYD